MRVDIKYSLSGIPSRIQHNPVTTLNQTQVFGSIAHPNQKGAYIRWRLILKIVEAGGAALWDDQHVDLGLRLDVLESEHIVVLINDRGRNLACQDLVKNRVRSLHRNGPFAMMLKIVSKIFPEIFLDIVLDIVLGIISASGVPMKRIHLKRIILIALTGMAAMACRDRGNASARVKSYEENGVVWGWGDIRLAAAPVTTGIFLDRLPSGAPNGQTFKLVGADSSSASTTDLFYADWHPLLDSLQPVVFASQFYLQDRSGARGTMDVYVKLKKPGRTWPDAFTLAVGTADVRNASAGRYPVRLSDGLKVSLISAGQQHGAVAFHYADLPYESGNSDIGTSPPPENRLEADGFSTTQRGGQTLWSLAPGGQGKLTFISKSLQAKPEDHPRLCHDKFFAVGRTAGNQVNKSCKLTLAPADGNSGWLTCALFVQIDNPATNAEKTCRVIGSFLADGDRGDQSDQLSAVIVQGGAPQ